MNYAIAFFDIDGTMLDFGAPDISPAVEKALKTLQEQGYKLFIATGRAPYNIPQLGSLVFDGTVCFNGSYCFDKDGVIFAIEMGR